MINSILSEVFVMKIIKVRFVKEFVVEAIMTVVFIVIANSFDLWIACGLYAVAVALYFVYERENLLPVLNQLLKFVRRDSK